MKYSLKVLQLVLVLAPLSTASLMEPEIPAFIKTMKEMHQGPPRHPTTRKSHVKTRWITQKLDNFDEANNKTWQNRILINEHNFVEGSPIFIYLGGEWRIQPGDIGSVHLADIAKEHKGTILTTEHRFYGESIPIKPLSSENLSKYQNVKQALADVVNVIKVLKEEDKYKDSKVVVQGCSYSATMATWLKKLYPDVIVGSWASSAPLEAKVNFREFMKVVGEAYRELGGDYCYNIIDNATSYFENLFYNGQGAQAKKELNLCSDFDENDERDQWQYFSTVANVFANLAQYQNPQNKDLSNYCSNLRNFSDNDYEALSKFVQWRLENPECVSTKYQDAVDYYVWSKDNYDGDGLAWTFQTCSEFGWFQSSGSRNQPFGTNFPVTLYTDICEAVFGSDYSEAKIRNLIKETNADFGGIESVEDVYFTQGGLDPWAKVGAGVAQGATIIPQAAHCSDLGSISASDSAALRASKERVSELIAQWLA
ncbi:putative serine protease K12H4.7 [Drosophila sulfurigaster albostrigata]|uniref:putative serine protease K12H4.7 n=1 Tax=Drosophila sulfurigaster albostrigata TaxID=89887 RepID=UPI002D21C8CF|nr:putative serine protease K12H4.7 [Drosophila sulfurigaster albostrigata]